MLYRDYKRLYASALKEYSPRFKKELQRQVDEYCDTLNFNAITGAGLEKTIKDLHSSLGVKMASISYRDVKKLGKKSIYYESKGVLTDVWKSVIFGWLDKKGLTKLVNDITNTTKEQIRRYLIKSQEENLPLNATIKLLRESGITDYRASLIARTETGKAANLGSMVGAISTGISTNKMWIATIDNRTRRTPPAEFDHLEMNGITIPMDEYFRLYAKDGGWEDLLHPCDDNASAANVCNCRCTIGYVVNRDRNNNVLTLEKNPPSGDVGEIWAMLATLT